MSDDNNLPGDSGGSSRARRGSFTSNTLSAIFGRSNSISGPSTGTPVLPTPISTASAGRRMSITTLGLSGTSPSQTASFFPPGRRASVSTASSDTIDENAVEDDEGPGRSAPTTPFGRRMSLGAQALLSTRTGNGNIGTTTGEGLNWSEQFRSRAEGAVSRPSFSTSPPNTAPRSPNGNSHERARSVSEMPAPPTAAIPTPSPKEQSALRRKPDAVGERILRGDFHMD